MRIQPRYIFEELGVLLPRIALKHVEWNNVKFREFCFIMFTHLITLSDN